MPNANCGAVMVSARWKKTVPKTAKRGGASRASAALGRSARQPFTAEAHAQLRDAIIAVQTDWSDAHGRVSKAALCEADEDADPPPFSPPPVGKCPARTSTPFQTSWPMSPMMKT